jgi:succinate dehydrogenase/fumarate reductase-like Fe-S protein
VENCIEVCPEAIPLNEAIEALTRRAVGSFWEGIVGKRRR